MLWTERYRPLRLGDILGQDHVTGHLLSFARDRSVPHLMLTGQHGTGKTCAITGFARELYGEEWQANTSVFQAADIFSLGKAWLEADERFAHLFRKQESLLVNFKYIIREYATMRPLDAPFKLMVFEDAHALPREAQQGLRRIMERTSDTCRFILSTTNQSAVIPAIASRCLPLFFPPADDGVVAGRLAQIRAAEGQKPGMHPCTDEQIDLIVQASRGDLRRAILLLQHAMQSGLPPDPSAVARSETATVAAAAFASAQRGDLRTAIREIESLVIDSGLSGSEVLKELRPVIRREYNHPALALALAETESRLIHGNNEYVHLGSLAAEIRERAS